MKSGLCSSSDKQDYEILNSKLREKLIHLEAMHISTASSANNSTLPSCAHTPSTVPFPLFLSLFTTSCLLHILFSLYIMSIPVYSPGKIQHIFQDPETPTLFCEVSPVLLERINHYPCMHSLLFIMMFLNVPCYILI